MLTNKLTEIKNIDGLRKIKNSIKILKGLSKVINLMKDLVELSQNRNIEINPYNGEPTQKIYKLLGDSSAKRGLSSSCNDNLQEAELWNKLIEFLEKEIEVQQQKALLQEPCRSVTIKGS